jgi:short-subunit dehydrogenase
MKAGSKPLALVTGAGGGIGTGVALMLRDRGYDVIAVDVAQDSADRAANALGEGALAVASDASDCAQVEALADRIRGEWADRLEVIVLNAGLIVPENVIDSAPAVLRTQLDVMLTAPIQHIAAAASVMAERGRGKILATVSMGGVLALPGSAAYSAAKSGLRAFLAATSAELKGSGVSVSGIYPSGVDTAMLRHEARNGGSVLNFVGKTFTVDDVVSAYARALDSDRLEIFLSTTDAVAPRLLGFSPQLANRLLPVMEWLGRRGHRAYLRRLDESVA